MLLRFRSPLTRQLHTLSSQPILVQPIISPLVDFTAPNLWTNATQRVIDDFRYNLQQWTMSFCPTCSRVHPFPQAGQLVECRHCKSQRDRGKVSKFGAVNDMDPGTVTLTAFVLI